MGYLKALGVLRLVSEQKDGEARGYWRDGIFVLEATLDPNGLLTFFLQQYSPTPLLAPWNGGSGFYIKLDLDHFLNTKGMEIEFKSELMRLADDGCPHFFDSENMKAEFKGREAVDSINALEASDSE